MKDKELLVEVLKAMTMTQKNAFKHHLCREGRISQLRVASMTAQQLAEWSCDRGARIAATKAKRNNLGRGERPMDAYRRVYAARLAVQLSYLKSLLLTPTDGDLFSCAPRQND